MGAISTSNTSEADASLSYFTTTHRPLNSHHKSPSISPMTQPTPSPVRPGISRRSHPPIRPHSRAKSDEVVGASRFSVQTIDENAVSHNSVPLLSIDHTTGMSSHNSHVSSEDCIPQNSQSLTNVSRKTSSSLASLRSLLQKCLPHIRQDLKHHDTTPIKQTGIRRRPRSELGTSSRAKERWSNCLLNRKAKSLENIPRRFFWRSSASATSVQKAPPAALRLPFPRNVSDQESTYQSKIRSETPFTQTQRQSLEIPSRRAPPSSRRTSSINPKAIFSAPVQMVRKFYRLPTIPKQPSIRSRSTSPSILDTADPMVGHYSQLRRKRTHDALRQVSHLLRFMTRDKPYELSREPQPLHTRTMSSKSVQSIKESMNGKKRTRAMTQGLSKIPLRITTQKSMELGEPLSDSSSIRDLQLGPPLNATPDPLATYKLKRSPSAATEEFLKVDISIRGGTSYLPSEARRIHTPPLPNDGISGNKRGFFFDYNAPDLFVVGRGRPNFNEITDNKAIATGKFNINNPRTNSIESSPSSKCTVETFDRKTYPRPQIRKRVKAVEWYESKLADFDNEIDGTEAEQQNLTAHNRASNFVNMRRRTAQALYKMRNRNAKTDQVEEDESNEQSLSEPEQNESEEEGQIDYEIPEHYPTSPLCPANPKYWRFVDGKVGRDKRLRTCWMHGELMSQDNTTLL